MGLRWALPDVDANKLRRLGTIGHFLAYISLIPVTFKQRLDAGDYRRAAGLTNVYDRTDFAGRSPDRGA